MAGDIALGTLASVLAAEGKHVATVATPIRAYVSERLKAMGNAVVDLLFVTLLEWPLDDDETEKGSTYARIGLGYTLGDDFLVTLLVAGISTVFALITKGVEQEIVAKGA